MHPVVFFVFCSFSSFLFYNVYIFIRRTVLYCVFDLIKRGTVLYCVFDLIKRGTVMHCVLDLIKRGTVLYCVFDLIKRLINTDGSYR